MANVAFSYPIVTAATSVALAILLMALSMRVSAQRRSTNIGIGDGGDKELFMRIRTHANLAENVPVFLILLGLIELSGMRSPALAWVAAIFVVVRICHVIGMAKRGANIWRMIGAAGTLAMISGLALLLLYRVSQIA